MVNMSRKSQQITLLLLLGAFFLSFTGCQQESTETFEPPTSEPDDSTMLLPEVGYYLTLGNQSQLLELQEGALSTFNASEPLIQIDPKVTFQSMEGFGFALTGGSALHIQSMSESARSTLLNELFGGETSSLNLNLIRISIGASDLDLDPFSYADTPNNQPDPELSSFTLAKDQVNLIPTLKAILAINPDIKIMGSPWSAPAWMKTSNSPIGGSLLPEYYETYARYFIQYLQAMSAEGITVDFISVQNEPLHDGNNPSMVMQATEQAIFIKDHLGPALQEAGIDTKVLAYDHNPDRMDYPEAVLADTEANAFVYGSAFHLYGGNISSLSGLNASYPDKHIFFTEQWYESPGNFREDLKWHIREVVIGSTRNWSEGIIEWNLSSNTTLTPRTNGGCTKCLGAITIDGDAVMRNPGYYVIAHVSKFVPRGSQRIQSTFDGSLPNVAFLTPDREVVLLVLNDTDRTQRFSVNANETGFSTALDAGAVATFKWTL